jgi:hypothetical protein
VALLWSAKPITMTNPGVPRPRHGTVTPITLREWNHIRGIPTSDVPTTAAEPCPGRRTSGAATLTAEVRAEDVFETGGQVASPQATNSRRCTSSAASRRSRGRVARADGPPGGRHQVTGELGGFDILEPSHDSASIA